MYYLEEKQIALLREVLMDITKGPRPGYTSICPFRHCRICETMFPSGTPEKQLDANRRRCPCYQVQSGELIIDDVVDKIKEVLEKGEVT